jgi:hypothetical protein
VPLLRTHTPLSLVMSGDTDGTTGTNDWHFWYYKFVLIRGVLPNIHVSTSKDYGLKFGVANYCMDPDVTFGSMIMMGRSSNSNSCCYCSSRGWWE